MNISKKTIFISTGVLMFVLLVLGSIDYYINKKVDETKAEVKEVVVKGVKKVSTKLEEVKEVAGDNKENIGAVVEDQKQKISDKVKSKFSIYLKKEENK